jgi:hypothetical protein
MDRDFPLKVLPASCASCLLLVDYDFIFLRTRTPVQLVLRCTEILTDVRTWHSEKNLQFLPVRTMVEWFSEFEKKNTSLQLQCPYADRIYTGFIPMLHARFQSVL